jgi:hypothetical protein
MDLINSLSVWVNWAEWEKQGQKAGNRKKGTGNRKAGGEGRARVGICEAGGQRAFAHLLVDRFCAWGYPTSHDWERLELFCTIMPCTMKSIISLRL